MKGSRKRSNGKASSGAGTEPICRAEGVEAQNEAMLGHLASMKAAQALFGEMPQTKYKTDPKDPTGTRLILDKDGQPVEDPDKISKMVWQSLYNKNHWDNQLVAMLTNNTDLATMNEHTVIAGIIAKEVQSHRYGSGDEAS